jgi:predicted secreted protein
MYLYVGIVKLVAIAGLTICALHFEKWWIILFALLCVPSLETSTGDNDKIEVE